ncbi:tRNA pseudouridine(38-40) synthase TruA [Sporomusa acidovorans]|uniref:tRNA pseudouridine synthase A n=1 Tax=Sporomusa acidovorans (strain ATCC 49682 / DSM 3132 / Mol) TaxID=1123286 RepID=A0ABZ3IWU8_SPOA4|nr:tRNA pseudouridine(38-40) synthase TruA [Sporomusa acidovorans]OZC13945.1 tRNA pseudouridine synthase A [Sporomusa acidovorans DSM 3132]SDF40110.1 tRNA pseudouridine38-40 synthase [Sporomusa acidovorans]
MRNIKLNLAYDGTAYHGFQRQTNAITIQQVLEEQLPKIFGHPLTVCGAGRTDAGVHAYGQVVSFFTTGTVPTERIPLAAKSVLPHDIVITHAAEESVEFHARYSAQSKIYRYRIVNSRLANPFELKYAWHFTRPLDIALMQAALQAIVGTHDFSAFRATGGAPISPVRTIMTADCRAADDSIIEFEFWGTGFLYHMVRNLVGTLVEVGRRRMTPAGFDAVLQGRDRRAAGVTAPPHGLYLVEVKY